ncbi:DUF4225 domain-containing protein [Xenorhabdus sp. PR6a]|uniref:DUF4225 domain-containing protein n=1 Tax=Xenorhabdus sp. PR6a TaxID=3025877 RepID=UPI00235A3B03|nr:DUF4225 domain-containing protein [Xenorhabdus sp. PR6a]MDC9583064.1 DUF4225 domain-containing protein [Xenorhabdus sp. PR6a]
MYSKSRENDYYNNMVSITARSLKEISLSASILLKNIPIRRRFENEISNFSQHHVNIANNTKSPEIKRQAMLDLKKERDNISFQANSIKNNLTKQYAHLEIRRKLDFSDYMLKAVGIVIGTTQVITGSAIIASKVTGTVGTVAGAGLVVHGFGAIEENVGAIVDNNVFYKGHLRRGYEYSAELLGFSKTAGTLVYAGVDLTLSGYGLFRSALKPEAWRLFYYINTDYVFGYQLMNGYALFLEIGADFITIKSAYDTYNDSSYNKKN